MKYLTVICLLILSLNSVYSAPSSTSRPQTRPETTPQTLTTLSEEDQKINELLSRSTDLIKKVDKMIETLTNLSPILHHIEIDRLKRDKVLLLGEILALSNAHIEAVKHHEYIVLMDAVVAIEEYLKILENKHYRPTTIALTTLVSSTTSRPQTRPESTPHTLTTLSEEDQKIKELLARSTDLVKKVDKMIETLTNLSPILHHLEIDRLKRDKVLLLGEILALSNAHIEAVKHHEYIVLMDAVVAIEEYLKILENKHYSPTTIAPTTIASPLTKVN